MGWWVDAVSLEDGLVGLNGSVGFEDDGGVLIEVDADERCGFGVRLCENVGELAHVADGFIVDFLDDSVLVVGIADGEVVREHLTQDHDLLVGGFFLLAEPRLL